MNSNELKKCVRQAAIENNINGVMELNELCAELNYARVSKVWHGVTSAKIADYTYVLNKLNKQLKFVDK